MEASPGGSGRWRWREQTLALEGAALALEGTALALEGTALALEGAGCQDRVQVLVQCF